MMDRTLYVGHKMTKYRKSIRVVVIAVVTMSALYAAYFISPRAPFFWSTEFVQTEWLKGDDRVRGEMVHDLVQRKLFDDRSRAEIAELLGEPDGSGPTWMSYSVDIGEKFFDGPWGYTLTIYFDESGRFEKYHLMD